jgi:dipeptidyl aminopeptidase/acylaminoacyl peptidase
LTRKPTLDDGRFAPSWSADGRSIAFVSNANDFWEDDLWLVDVASGRHASSIVHGLVEFGLVPRRQRIAVWEPPRASTGTRISPLRRRSTDAVKKSQDEACDDWLHSSGLLVG